MSTQDHSIPALPAFQGLGVSIESAGLNAKRMLDIAVSHFVLLLILPVLALITLAVSLDSKGPVLFAQRRIGRGGRPFAILKFRSMHVQEDGADIRQAVKGDARVTRTGRFLRATSLDELPQLFNVLAGDMSLVGPRPHAIAHDEFYGTRIANYHLRRMVKPGITGWAQINGHRGATPELADMQARIDCDQFYVEHESLTLDLKILAATPLAVLTGRNAH